MIFNLYNSESESRVLKIFHHTEMYLEQLRIKMRVGSFSDTAHYQQVENNFLELKGLTEIVNAISKHKKSWDSSGLISKLNEWEVIKKLKVDQLLNEPGNVAKMARGQFNLTGLQKLFLKMNKLRLGQNSFSSSSLSFQNYLNNGSLVDLAEKGKSAMVLFGRSFANNSINDLPFVNSSFSSSIARALQVGKQNESTGSTSISFINLDQGFSTAGMPSTQDFRRSFVVTVNKEIILGPNATFSTEISRSVSGYNLKDRTDAGADIGKIVSTEDLKSNTAFVLHFREERPGFGTKVLCETEPCRQGL